MEPFVDVTGEAQMEEMATKFIAHVQFEVRAAKDETAFRDLEEMHKSALAMLREQGIGSEELLEGGADLHRPWYWKKQVGQFASRRLILKVADYQKLQRALAALEPVQSANRDRKTITINFRQPEFESSDETKSTVLVRAFERAKRKAQRLAEAMTCQLGPALRVEEWNTEVRNSGFSRDEDWFGDRSRFGAQSGAIMLAAAADHGDDANQPASPLNPSRTLFVKCRVRFSLVAR